MKCSQKLRSGEQCPNDAVASYLWPGQERAYACLEHAQKAAGLAEFMGFHLELVAVKED